MEKNKTGFFFLKKKRKTKPIRNELIDIRNESHYLQIIPHLTLINLRKVRSFIFGNSKLEVSICSIVELEVEVRCLVRTNDDVIQALSLFDIDTDITLPLGPPWWQILLITH